MKTRALVSGLDRWLIAWGDLAGGMVGVMSFGFWCPDLGALVRLWAMRRGFTRRNI